MKPVFIVIFCLYILSVFGCLYFTKTFFIPRLQELCDPRIKSESDKKKLYWQWSKCFILFSLMPIINFFFLAIFVIQPLDSIWNDFVFLIEIKFGSVNNFIDFGLNGSKGEDDSN